MRAFSLDHLVGAYEQRCRHFESKCFRSLKIYRRLVFGWRLDRKVGLMGSAEDAVDIGCRLPEHLDEVYSIGHETTGCDPKSRRINSRQAMAGREHDDLIAK